MATSWRVKVTEPGPMNGPQLLVHVVNCHAVFRALTKAQRAALLGAVDGNVSAGTRVLGALEAHGLTEGGRLSEAGVEVRRWNVDIGQKDDAGLTSRTGPILNR